ncbi:MAG TPA: glycosyltransferase family 2 protein [Gammaproteobacteria bacterium]|nr:glycosyltransferase family 2 protein [Gammaproteobacteria bacterium]
MLQQNKCIKLSIIIPACNEKEGLSRILPQLVDNFPHAEILIIDDGSTDDTAKYARSLGVRVISHPHRLGNGAAIKTGARAAQGEVFVLMDADGQHSIGDIQRLLETFQEGYDMVVGARSRAGQANFVRYLGNRFYNWIATLIVNQKVQDLTSGFRVVRAKKFKEFLHLLPNGFSYPSTITLAFFRMGYPIRYIPIDVFKRLGKSHLRPLSDGLRFFILIYKITILYSPLKIFLPLGFIHLALGLLNYAYTFATSGRFTNMSAVFLTSAIIIFLIGLVSEQITILIYRGLRDS